MLRFAKHAAAAAIAFAAVGAFAHPAAAQASGAYCNGAVQLRSLYRNIVPNGQTHSEAVYLGQFQANGRPVRATVARIERFGRFRVIRIIGRIDLTTPYDFKQIEVLSLDVDNPAGNGAPSPEEVKNHLVVSCSFS